jgi:UDP-glucose 4-epimerase
VVPLFLEQLRAGTPLTVTDPEMTRFLMTLDDAVELVEHAFGHAAPGDVFIRKAPASTIAVLASAVAQALDADPAVKVIGTRHGEKLYESLASREEMARAQDQGDFYRVAVDDRDLNYTTYFEEGDEVGTAAGEYTSHNTQRLDAAEVCRILVALPDVQAEIRRRAS